jgi:hypothetical protein
MVRWIKTFKKLIFRWQLSLFILWLRVCVYMPSGNQYYLSILYAKKQMMLISNTLKCKFKSNSNRIRKDFFYTKVWTLIFRTNYKRIGQFCHTKTLEFWAFLPAIQTTRKNKVNVDFHHLNNWHLSPRFICIRITKYSIPREFLPFESQVCP